MAIEKKCETCSVLYKAARSASKFCSVKCKDAKQTSTRKIVACRTCGKEFSAKQDHGVWQRYCCRACFTGQSGAELEAVACGACGGIFTPDQRGRVYCSQPCRHAGLRKGVEKNCVNCGGVFYLSPSKVKKRREESCCSTECRYEYYKEDRSKEWEGGNYLSEQAGHSFTLLVRPGYVGKYIQDHRLAASKALGRPIERGEVVIAINRDKTDTRSENLFVCGSMSEYARMRSGSIPWPQASNIGAAK